MSKRAAPPADENAELVELRREVERLRSLVQSRAPRLIGRERELLDLRTRLRARRGIVTIVGPPGVGKTALARALAQSATRRSCFCPLDDAGDPARVSVLVAEALRLESGEGPVDPRVGRALRARGAFLLVLDNLEQVQGQLDVLERWLDDAPQLRLLTTSRRPLGLSLESVLELGPLALPTSDDDLECDAAQLFVERARVGVPELELTPAAARSIVRIVRGLDGIPLAVELVASRVAHQPLSRIAETLGRPSLVVEGTSRHSSIERAILDSWELLAPPERRALAICSLFRGGFDLEAAAFVLDLAAGEALGILQRLVNHSLSMIERRPEGGARHHFLESIRDFAEARLAETEGEREALLRHADYYLSQLAPERRREEGPNLAAILARCLALPDQSDRAALAALALAAVGDAASLLHAAPALLLSSASAAMRLRVAIAAAKCADRMQQPEAAEVYLQGAREVSATLGAEAAAECDLLEARLRLHHGDVGDVRAALARLSTRPARTAEIDLEALVLSANADLFEGRLSDAERSFERAVQLGRLQHNVGIEARGLNGLSATHHLQGAFTESLEEARAAAATAAGSGDPIAEGRARSNAGLLAAEYGELESARSELERAQQQLERHGDLRHAATAAQNLAAVFRELGDLERATRAALASQRNGGRRLIGFALAELGYIAHERGDITRAKSYYDRALDAHRAAGNRYFSARMLPFCAATLALLGRAEDAEAAFTEAERYFLEVGDRIGSALASLLRGQSDLVQARAAAAASQPVEPHLTRARERLAREVRGTSPELRFARSLLERDLRQASSPEGHRLRIAADGAWFALASARQNLRTRHALKRLLSRLASVHDTGATLSVDDLFHAGWPGERARPKSAARRVYVAIATLRKLGLRDHIERHSEGYRLVGAVELEGP